MPTTELRREEKQFKPRDRDQELAIQLRLQASLERSYARRYAALLNRYAKAAAAGFESGRRRGALTALQGFERDLRPILTANVTEAANVFGRRVIELFDNAQKRADTVFEQRILEYLSRHGAEKITSITDTTRADILAVIAGGEADGMSLRDITLGIRARVGGAAARNRAQTIAITETHSAATYASDKAAEATGLRLLREWVSAEDSRTRSSHVAADGQKVGMDEPFIVGGASLMRPGDPAGPASETIRCRCIVTYDEAP